MRRPKGCGAARPKPVEPTPLTHKRPGQSGFGIIPRRDVREMKRVMITKSLFISHRATFWTCDHAWFNAPPVFGPAVWAFQSDLSRLASAQTR